MSSAPTEEQLHFDDINNNETQPLVIPQLETQELIIEGAEKMDFVVSEPDPVPGARNGRSKKTVSRAASVDVTAVSKPVKAGRAGRSSWANSGAPNRTKPKSRGGDDVDDGEETADDDDAAQIQREALQDAEDGGYEEVEAGFEIEPVKKGRGRPKGSTAVVDPSEDASYGGKGGKAKGRGRPKGTTRQPLPGELSPFKAAEFTPNTRGRGRPKKRSLTEATSGVEDEGKEASPTPKRRGRPPKTEGQNHTPATNGNGTSPRKRGRPAKNTGTEEEKPKARGRPKKVIDGTAKSTALGTSILHFNAQNWDLRGFTISMSKVYARGEEKSQIEGSFDLVPLDGEGEEEGVRAGMEVNGDDQVVTMRFTGELV
jgi:hypothetical protein